MIKEYRTILIARAFTCLTANAPPNAPGTAPRMSHIAYVWIKNSVTAGAASRDPPQTRFAIVGLSTHRRPYDRFLTTVGVASGQSDEDVRKHARCDRYTDLQEVAGIFSCNLQMPREEVCYMHGGAASRVMAF